MLARQRTFSLVAILTLALGVGATTAIFSVVYGILLRPLPHVEFDRLVTLGQTATSNPQEPVDGSSSHVNFLDWKRSSKTIPSMALRYWGAGGHQQPGCSRRRSDRQRHAGLLRRFPRDSDLGARIHRGREPTDWPARGRRQLWLLAGPAWSQARRAVADGRDRWPAVAHCGRCAPWLRLSERARLWMPVRNNDEQCGRGCVYLNGIGRLANGATVEAAQGEMTAVASALERDFHGDNANVTVMVQSLHDRTVGSVQLALVVLLAAVTMVLLIACANVANLLLVRGAARHSEIAVRTALGAGRRGIVSYLLTENLVLAIGGVFGLLLAVWGIEVLTALAPANLPRLDDVRFDAPTFAFALTIVLATTVIFGLGPPSLSRVSLSRALGQRGSVGTNRPRWTRSTLLVSEVALSLILLLGAGLLLRSLSALQKTDMGFDPADSTVFTISLPPARYPAASRRHTRTPR